MSSTPQILKLVRDGRVSPRDAALLMDLRDRVRAKRERAIMRKSPMLGLGLLCLFFFLGLLGIRRSEA